MIADRIGFYTEEFARRHGISVQSNPPLVEGIDAFEARSARQVATRAVILQGIVAVAAGVDAKPIVDWFQEQQIWQHVSPREEAFLGSASLTGEERSELARHMEAEWALLWMVGKVEALGLPTRACDSRRLVDDIIPPLGSDISSFLASAELRPPGMLLAEDDRTYNLWCCVLAARRNGEPIPPDLRWHVLYERRYAFEWLTGPEGWDAVRCDA